MITFEAETYDDLQRGVCNELLANPEYVGGEKGKIVREILSATMRIRDPRGRVTSSPTRAMNYGPLVAAFVRNITMDALAAEQRQVLTKALLADSSTRDAIVYDAGVAMQLFIRNNRLHMHATASSLDAIWKLTNTVFVLTMVQEIILLDLRDTHPEIELGEAVIVAGSLVLHERHFELATIMTTEDDRNPVRMPPLNQRLDLDRVAYDETALREGRLVSGSGYDGAAAWLFDKLLHYRLYRDETLKWPRYQAALVN